MAAEEEHARFGGYTGACRAFLENHGGGLAREGFGRDEWVDGGFFAVGTFVVFG